MNPEFASIVEDTIELRNRIIPSAKVTILSNASMIHKPDVFNALLKLDLNIQKLDAGHETFFHLVNQPVVPVNFGNLVRNLERFNGKVIIQSLFLRGTYNGKPIDNTIEREVNEWLRHIASIRPSAVMIYPISRATPAHNLEKITIFELEKIAEKVRKIGIEAKVYN